MGFLLALLATAPMFSPWYGEALRGVLDMEESDAVRLERQVAAHPDDFVARLKVMAYYQRADRQESAKRARHALWLMEHHPESEILHSPISRFVPGELTAQQYARAVSLWEKAAKIAAVQWNAATFFEGLDPALHLHYLETTAAADPNHPFALRPLAHLYALATLEKGLQPGLEASKNVWVLGNAAYMLQSQYNLSVQQHRVNPRAAELAERYFARAKALDPNLDRKAILPQLADAPAVVPVKARAVEIRRLPLDAFPQLPPAIAGVLRSRNCLVLQPSAEGPARNVIRGEFFVKGEEGWAVLCSVKGSTTLLAFRNGQEDTRPEVVSRGEDSTDRVIMAVDRPYIQRHYRAYGGPAPPPIDHNGIDDGILEKGSVTMYFHQGKWLRLQGAD